MSNATDTLTGTQRGILAILAEGADLATYNGSWWLNAEHTSGRIADADYAALTNAGLIDFTSLGRVEITAAGRARVEGSGA